jgi:hypothetical protein
MTLSLYANSQDFFAPSFDEAAIKGAVIKIDSAVATTAHRNWLVFPSMLDPSDSAADNLPYWGTSHLYLPK